MKMKSAPIAVLALSVLATMMITPIHSATSYSYSVYGRTDKSSYIPGDSGILYLTIKNTGGGSFTVRNVTIEYPWKAFITDHWDGNFTTTAINQAVGTPGGTWNTQYSFTVPTDGRAYYGSTITITIGTDITTGNQQGIYTTSSPIVIALAAYQPFSLATSILPIISIVLIAAAVVMLTLVYMGIRKQSKK
jgi:hypothetical protein